MADQKFSQSVDPLKTAGLTDDQIHMMDFIDPVRSAAYREKLLYDALQYKDPMSDPGYAASMGQLQKWGTGELSPEDRAREYEALGQAQSLAGGEQGAIAQDAASRGGGGAGVNSVRAQVAAQGAASRVARADVSSSGMAASRAIDAQREFSRQMAMNADLQNRFAIQKTGALSGAYKDIGAAAEAEQAALNSNLHSFIGTVADAYQGVTAKPKAASSAAAPATATAAPSAYATTAATPDPASTTAADAAKAYAASLPFAGSAAPGSAPSSVSNDDLLRRRQGGY